MHRFRLEPRERQKLLAHVKAARDARSVRRAIALLELGEGRPVAHVANTIGVTRQTLYNWVERYQSEGLEATLGYRRGRGRPTTWTEFARRFLAWSMAQRPDEMGYAATDWTTTLLRHHLERCIRVRVSDTSLREQLHGLGYAWKRPRYVLQPDPEREKKTPDPPRN